MSTWDNFIWFISNPYIIALLLMTFTLQPIIKYLRRFYPESHKEAALESENFIKELQKNKEDKKIYVNANLKIMLFIFGPGFTLMIGFLAYDFSTGLGLKACCISKTFSDIAPIIIIMLGIYTIKTDKVHRVLFKDNYQKVMEFTHKQSGKDPLLKNYEKYAPILGWFFLILGIIGLMIQIFDK